MARPPEHTPELPGDSGPKTGEYPRWWEAFWSALADRGVKLYAARDCGIDESTPRKWLALNSWAAEEYQARESEAMSCASQHLVMEARRRARDGWYEPVYYQGAQCGVVRKYSDTLLIFLLKGAMPETYRERFDVSARVAVSGIDDLLAATDEGDEGGA